MNILVKEGLLYKNKRITNCQIFGQNFQHRAVVTLSANRNFFGFDPGFVCNLTQINWNLKMTFTISKNMFLYRNLKELIVRFFLKLFTLRDCPLTNHRTIDSRVYLIPESHFVRLPLSRIFGTLGNCHF